MRTPNKHESLLIELDLIDNILVKSIGLALYAIDQSMALSKLPPPPKAIEGGIVGATKENLIALPDKSQIIPNDIANKLADGICNTKLVVDGKEIKLEMEQDNE
jgi:hypothetical protein